MGQETIIGANLTVLPNDAQGRLDVQILTQHEVRDNERWGAAVTFTAVDNHSAVLLSQGLVNEVCSPFKVGTEVELLCVVGLDTQIGDAGVLVEVGIGVDMHEGPALSSIQDMGDA